MKFCIIGAGYVGLSLSTLISRKHPVIVVEIDDNKVKMINEHTSPIADREIQDALSSGNLDLHATTDIAEAIGSDYVIIATPTNYDPAKDSFDTSSVDSVMSTISEISPESIIVVKSTVPIGYTEKKRSEGFLNTIFSPEFLREGRALYDNLHPSRIIVGVPGNDIALKEKVAGFADILEECSDEDSCPKAVMGSTEAESVKLFSNTYLAMRVAFFNELDSFAEVHGLNSREIIEGVCLDPRIGDWYNNPSFGYGGYCLPKDTKQLLSNYKDTPNELIRAIVKSNATRKGFIVSEIVKRAGTGVVGIYRLAMKTGSDNFRESSILDIARQLRDAGIRIQVYEPTLKSDFIEDMAAVKDLDFFKNTSKVIIANRMGPELDSVKERVITRDIYARDRGSLALRVETVKLLDGDKRC